MAKKKDPIKVAKRVVKKALIVGRARTKSQDTTDGGAIDRRKGTYKDRRGKKR